MPTNAPTGETRVPPSTSPAGPKRQWLVSVRDLAEAKRAARFGVDLLDLKEPLLGPLSPVSVEIWNQVRRQAERWSADHGGGPLISAALGESDQAVGLAESVPSAFAFAKAGPSGCESPSRISGLWDALRARLPASVELVAVAYADHHAARCLPAEKIVALAAQAGFRRILLDTFEKKGRSTIDVLGDRLSKVGCQIRRQHLWWSLAGSITLTDVEQIAKHIPEPEFRPDCFAVRGDVCDGHRTETLSIDRLIQWQRAFR